MKIIDVIPNDDRPLDIKAGDGRAGLFGASPCLDSEAFAPLKDGNEFKRVHNGNYFIEWDGGVDLTADTIPARWKPIAITARQNSGANA